MLFASNQSSESDLESVISEPDVHITYDEKATEQALHAMPDLGHARIRVLARFIVLGCIIIALNGGVWSLIWLELGSLPMAILSFSFIIYAYITYRITYSGKYYRAFTFMATGVVFWLILVAIVASGPGLGYGGAVHGFFLTLAACFYIVLDNKTQLVRYGSAGAMLLLFLAFHVPFYPFEPVIVLAPQSHLLAGQITWMSVIVSIALFLFFSSNHSIFDQKLQYSDISLNNVFVAAHKSKHATYIQTEHKKRMVAKVIPKCSMLFLGLPNLSELLDKYDETLVMEQLNALLGEFDNIVYDMALDKIDTVKSAYMVSASITSPNDEQLTKLVEASKRFINIAKRFSLIDIRIGIHTGAVTAGIIDDSQSVYSLWGKNVDYAYRIQKMGVVGGVSLSEQACKYVKGSYQFEYYCDLLNADLSQESIYQLV